MKSISITAQLEDRINILEVIGNAGQGGMENYIENFISHLPTNKFKITCICPYESPFTAALRNLGVEEVYITPITDDPAWRSIQLTSEIAKLHQIDVLHAHMPVAHILAGLAGCLIHKPVIATLHGMNVSSQELGITRAVESHLISNCQEAYTQALAMGVPPERINLVRNGVDTAIFNPERNGAGLRTLIDVSPTTPLVGFVGRLVHEKGPDLFLRAVDQVHLVRPDAHFVIVGDGVMRNKLEETSVHLGLSGHVHFVGWSMNTVDVYPAFDFLVHTSRSDGTSLVLLEAMASGCPAVGLAVGGVPEIIENERTGFLAGAGDWEGIAFRIIQLLDQPERIQKMKVAARDRVRQHFDVSVNTRRISELISHIAFAGPQGHTFTNPKTISKEEKRAAAFDSLKGDTR